MLKEIFCVFVANAMLAFAGDALLVVDGQKILPESYVIVLPETPTLSENHATGTTWKAASIWSNGPHQWNFPPIRLWFSKTYTKSAIRGAGAP